MTAIRPISVIVCTRSRADRMPGMINQLRLQMYPGGAFEIIVVDNGSTDHTRDVIKELAASAGVPVRYICESRPGITSARNRGAEEARYHYLAYVDDDCRIGTDWLWELAQGFDLDDDVVAVGGRVVLHRDHRPGLGWLSPELEPWLGANSHLGGRPRLLTDNEQVIECNMALTLEAWRTCGGFVGMEQFGSRHAAASEVIHLLRQIARSGKKVAYVPTAVVHHCVGVRTWEWMVQRAYWQGVSDGMLDYLVSGHAWMTTTGRGIFDLAAILVLLGCAGSSFLGAKSTKGRFYFLRAVRRIGLLLSETRLVGDWDRVSAWMSTRRLAE